ncbi:MAG: ABC transporter substrate-binding protein [Hyphomicrobiaceae bacterium]
MQRRFTSIVAVAAVCSIATTSGAFAEDIKIGVLTPLSGVYASIGKVVRVALEIRAKEINDKGGVLGRKLALVFEDAEGNPATGTQRAEKLFQVEKVDFLTGTVHSGVTLAVGQVAERNNRLMATTVSFSNAITGAKCSPNVFRVNPSAGMQASALALWVADYKKGAKIYYLGPDYEMGRSTIAEFRKQAEALGAKNAGEVYAPLNSKDYSQYFGQIRAARPDVFYTSTAGTDSARLLTQLKEYGLTKFQNIGASSAVTSDNIGAMGNAAEGFVTPGNYSTLIDTPANKDFVKKFKAAAGIDPNLYAADSYTVLDFYRLAAEKAKSLDTDKLRIAMRGLSWDGVVGKKTMRAGDHQAVQDMYALKLNGTVYKPLAKIDGEKAVGPDTCKRW